MLGFSAHMIETRLGSDHQLVKVYHLLDWNKFSELLSNVYKRKEKVAGVKPYDPVKMFRAMILQAWHSLSDPKMEEALKVRLDFMWFTDFELTEHRKKKNRLISKVRYIVEQDFGILKNRFGFSRASYFGVDKVHAQGLRKMVRLNLKKAANMIKWVSDIPGKSKYALSGAV